MSGVPRTVIGVLPQGFRFLSSEARLYLPLSSSPQDRAPTERHSGGDFRHMIARLSPDATRSHRHKPKSMRRMPRSK